MADDISRYVVWFIILKNKNDTLIQLLQSDFVLMHPMILAEIACGTPPAPQRTLSDLDLLPKVIRPLLLKFWRSSIGIKTPKRLKKHHKTDVSSTPLLLHMNGTDD
ncbi:hypothetical protein ACLBOM_37710 [Escherichia coli]